MQIVSERMCYNGKDKASMTRHEIMLILERYDVDPKTHNIIANKILALSDVVGRSEQLKAFCEWLDEGYKLGGTSELLVRDYLDDL